MKKVLLTFCILSLITSISRFFFQRRWQQTRLFPSGTTVTYDARKGITIIKPVSREWMFISTWSTTKLLWLQTQATVVINANYFWHTQNDFFIAGHHSLVATGVDTTYCARDKNLCGYIHTKNLHIEEWITFSNDALISAGPILLRKGIINPELTEQYSHRQRKTKRTILINSKEWVFFLLTQKNYTLPKIASYIQKKFWPETTAINLDWGPSTSLRTTDRSFLFNENERLPLFFVIK